MKDFGIRFAANNSARLARLQALVAELKKDKNAALFRDPDAWTALVPDEIKPNFAWPSVEERKTYLARRPPVVIDPPSKQLGAKWDFYRVFESVEEGDYELLGLEIIDDATAEIRINPMGYPYGGLGPFIALAEAYGFQVIGVNEYGKYESREELIGKK